MTDISPPEPRSGGRTATGAPEPGPGGTALRVGLAVAALVLLATQFGVLALLIVGAVIVFVFLHELGHYLTARWAGMKVTEFFLGFGPRLWSFRRGETEYGFKAVPAGAYVRIIGMSNLEQVDPAEERRTYRQQPYWRRMSVALAGSAMHFLCAILLTFAVLAGFGVPDAEGEHWTIGEVRAPSPAAEAGLEEGDAIVAVDGRPVGTFEELRAELTARPGEEVELTVERDGERVPVTATLGRRHPDTGQAVGFLGVGPVYDRVPVPVPQAAVRSVTETGRAMWLSVQAIAAFFTPANLSDFFSTAVEVGSSGESAPPAGGAGDGGEGRVVSIVGAIGIGSDLARHGVAPLLAFLAILNVFIGVFNLIPLLPLDGGHVAVATYERLRSRRDRRYFADITKLMPLTYAVVLLLVLVGLTAVYLDISSPVQLR